MLAEDGRYWRTGVTSSRKEGGCLAVFLYHSLRCVHLCSYRDVAKKRRAASALRMACKRVSFQIAKFWLSRLAGWCLLVYICPGILPDLAPANLWAQRTAARVTDCGGLVYLSPGSVTWRVAWRNLLQLWHLYASLWRLSLDVHSVLNVNLRRARCTVACSRRCGIRMPVTSNMAARALCHDMLA